MGRQSHQPWSGAGRIRPSAVSGLFYPDGPASLQGALGDYVPDAERGHRSGARIIIAPHAGYRYSGPVAGAAFAELDRATPSEEPCVVFVLGPPHRVPVKGFALPAAEFLRTPLGDVRVNAAICEELLSRDDVCESEAAHAKEHSLEVEIPFIQWLFGSEVTIVPLLVGDASPGAVAKIFDDYWGQPSARFVVSTDLSHFLDDAAARSHDRSTVERILSLKAPDLQGEDACGCRAVNGLIEFAAHQRLEPRLLRLANSSAGGGPPDRVVGYGAFGFWGQA